MDFSLLDEFRLDWRLAGKAERTATDYTKALRDLLRAQPEPTFPVGFHDGAPLGVQATAHAWREDLLFEAWGALEDRLGHVAPVDPVG